MAHTPQRSTEARDTDHGPKPSYKVGIFARKPPGVFGICIGKSRCLPAHTIRKASTQICPIKEMKLVAFRKTGAFVRMPNL